MDLGSPGTEGGGQGHFCAGTVVRADAAADLAADHQRAQAKLGGVVVRGRLRFGHEDEGFLEVLVNAAAQLALDRQRVVQAETAEGQQAFIPSQLDDCALRQRRRLFASG